MDKAYQGLDKEVPPNSPLGDGPCLNLHLPKKKTRGWNLTEEEKAPNRASNRIRVGVEHPPAWTRDWQIPSQVLRCAHVIYVMVMATIAGFVNMQIAERRRSSSTLA